MTYAQNNALNAARESATLVAGLAQERFNLTPEQVRILITLIACSQMGMAREVAQWGANERAELARMTQDECIPSL